MGMQNPIRMAVLCRLSFVLLTVFLAAPAMAAGETAHPDISGFWNWAPASKDAPAAQTLIDALPDDVILLDDTGPVEYGPGEFGGLDPKPAARTDAEKWSPQKELAPENTCKKPTIIYAMQGPFPMEVFQGRGMTVFKLEYFDMVRVVHMDGRDLPPENAPHSQEGRSIGHWEGDTLVVDTRRFKEWPVSQTPRSKEARMTERFYLTDRSEVDVKGSGFTGIEPLSDAVLVDELTIHDPVMFDKPVEVTLYFQPVPDTMLLEYDCAVDLWRRALEVQRAGEPGLLEKTD